MGFWKDIRCYLSINVPSINFLWSTVITWKIPFAASFELSIWRHFLVFLTSINWAVSVCQVLCKMSFKYFPLPASPEDDGNKGPQLHFHQVLTRRANSGTLWMTLEGRWWSLRPQRRPRKKWNINLAQSHALQAPRKREGTLLIREQLRK